MEVFSVGILYFLYVEWKYLNL